MRRLGLCSPAMWGASGTEPHTLGLVAGWSLRRAALNRSPVAGLTHRFYRYPARFSPTFAQAAIALFSSPNDLVLDPYMGGGTTVVEALTAGRRAVGSDVNSLGVFVARVKTTLLGETERAAVRQWIRSTLPTLKYRSAGRQLESLLQDRRTHNLNLPQARAIKKTIALALASLSELPGENSQAFVRCVLLNAGQLFLNGRPRTATVAMFREYLATTANEMLEGLSQFEARSNAVPAPVLINGSARDLVSCEPFVSGSRADLVVTSPPYPGIHVLYHRWQVDGRKETPAPYWLANCQDGQGNAYYNFADRRPYAEDAYFRQLQLTLAGVHAVMKCGAWFVQLVAFSDPQRQIRRYLNAMRDAGFGEVRAGSRRIWRDVPGRRWHANLKGKIGGSREVVLVHRAR